MESHSSKRSTCQCELFVGMLIARLFAMELCARGHLCRGRFEPLNVARVITAQRTHDLELPHDRLQLIPCGAVLLHFFCVRLTQPLKIARQRRRASAFIFELSSFAFSALYLCLNGCIELLNCRLQLVAASLRHAERLVAGLDLLSVALLTADFGSTLPFENFEKLCLLRLQCSGFGLL